MSRLYRCLKPGDVVLLAGPGDHAQVILLLQVLQQKGGRTQLCFRAPADICICQLDQERDRLVIEALLG